MLRWKGFEGGEGNKISEKVMEMEKDEKHIDAFEKL